jgi:hypothetical protein
MSPQLIVLLVLAVIVLIGAGIYFQQRESPPGNGVPKEGPDSTDGSGRGADEGSSGSSDGGGGGEGGGN